ncbi:MAG TPA: DUF5670 family protein [Longimicrobiales bacterium]|nr:DUF5670 family protein [Longimicrobiales bacterium]
MQALLWIGLILIVLWVVGWLGFQLAGFLVHLLLIIGIILVIVGAVRWLAERPSSGP